MSFTFFVMFKVLHQPNQKLILFFRFVSSTAKSNCQVCVCMCVCVSMSHSSLPMIIARVTFWVSDSDRERMWKLLIYVCVCVPACVNAAFE